MKSVRFTIETISDKLPEEIIKEFFKVLGDYKFIKFEVEMEGK